MPVKLSLNLRNHPTAGMKRGRAVTRFYPERDDGRFEGYGPGCVFLSLRFQQRSSCHSSAGIFDVVSCRKIDARLSLNKSGKSKPRDWPRDQCCRDGAAVLRPYITEASFTLWWAGGRSSGDRWRGGLGLGLGRCRIFWCGRLVPGCLGPRCGRRLRRLRGRGR